jgi:hypothetical protein
MTMAVEPDTSADRARDDGRREASRLPAHDVFVSYSTGDKPVADAIVSRLEQAGIRCWVAPRDVIPGQVWAEAIIKAIETSRLMVVVLSGAANQSHQVIREVERAVAKDVVVIPFRIESVEPTGAMAYYLASEHWLDAMTPPLESHIAQLVRVAHVLLDSEATTPEPTPSPASSAPLVKPGLARVMGHPLAVPAVVLGGIVVGLLALLSFTGQGGEAEPSPHGAGAASPTAPVGIGDMAHAVVQIVSYVDGTPDAVGSGTIISPDGLILTNAHVVFPEVGTLDRLEIGITDSSDAPPDATFLAEVAAADGALDLAVLRITERIDGSNLAEDLPYVRLGDSDDLEIGDSLRILGYPDIGGETITLTSGQVSGFTSEAGLGHRAWIKTDATITGGNSGGLAANERGELIAVPTAAGASDDIVDCRAVRDTNRDGSVDEDDDCVPIGGFLNGLRPIALAVDMIEAVQNGVAYVPIAEVTPSIEPDDLEDVHWSDPVFGLDVTPDDEPIGEAIGLELGTTRVCAFWDYEGMQSGMRWSAAWSEDGVLDEEASFIDERWSLEQDGRFWVCIDDDSGLVGGLYDVAFTVEDEVLSTGFVYVADDVSSAKVTLRNAGDQAICYLFAAPSVATVWGQERIGETDVLSPGEDLSFELIGADYDLHAEDCEGETLFEEPVQVVGGTAMELEWSAAGLLSVDANPAGDGTELQVGDCINGEVGWSRANTDIVPCTLPHTYQIVGVVPYVSAEDTFPGEDALRLLGDEECSSAFEGFVGIAYEDSIWYLSWWLPTSETWEAGDRDVVCTLREENGEPIVGSKEGAAE